MGSDFLNKTKPTIIKHLDKKRVALCTPDIFTSQPQEQPRCAIASIASGVTVLNGETLIVEEKSGSLKLRRGNSFIGSLDSPSKEELNAIVSSGGAANGIVQRFHKLSNKAEVSLC